MTLREVSGRRYFYLRQLLTNHLGSVLGAFSHAPFVLLSPAPAQLETRTFINDILSSSAFAPLYHHPSLACRQACTITLACILGLQRSALHLRRTFDLDIRCAPALATVTNFFSGRD